MMICIGDRDEPVRKLEFGRGLPAERLDNHT
jgi:hypothetical protein